MRFCIKYLFFILISTSVFAQKTKCHKFIPFFLTYNVKNLTYRLTKNLANDSLKVEAIHCWITHHIKYDYKKFQSFDFSHVPLNKVLKKRKGICVAYSELFNTMCKYANIISSDVTGYIKNDKVDLNDKFYLDEHVRNAVYINHQWKLIDVCWDAGYVKYYKRTFLGKILQFVTFKTRDMIKYKPHFVFYPTKMYFLKSGHEFIFDHIPSNPIWQLTDPLYKIETCERDSSYYLNKRTNFKLNEYNSDNNAERLLVSKMTKNEKDIYIGPISYKYNYKNHFHYAKSLLIPLSDLYLEIDSKSKDTIKVINQCNLLIEKLNKSKLHFDSTNFYLYQQKVELKENNIKKYDTLKYQNKNLSASTIKALNKIKSGKTICKNSKKTIKFIEKSNNKRLENLLKSEKFYKANPLKTYSSKDSLNSVIKTIEIMDSLNLLNLKMKNHFKHLDSLYNIYSYQIQLYSNKSAKNFLTISYVISLRMNYLDDLDYNIRIQKDTLLKYKFVNDDLILVNNKVFVVKALSIELSKIKTEYKKLYLYHKLLLNEYVKLKKYHSDHISKLYSNNLMLYSKELNEYSAYLQNNKSNFIKLKSMCNKQYKKTKKELKMYYYEKDFEKNMYLIRSNYINNHYSALYGLSKNKINEINRMMKKVEKIKYKYTKT